MAWSYEQGSRDIRTIYPVETTYNNYLYYYAPDGTHGMCGVICQPDTSAQPVSWAISGCWEFDSTIQFALGQDVFVHIQAGYRAHMTHNCYFSDATTDMFIGKCVRTWQAGYQTTYAAGGGMFVFELSRDAQGRH